MFGILNSLPTPPASSFVLPMRGHSLPVVPTLPQGSNHSLHRMALSSGQELVGCIQHCLLVLRVSMAHFHRAANSSWSYVLCLILRILHVSHSVASRWRLHFSIHTLLHCQWRLNKLHDLQEPIMQSTPSALVHASCLSLSLEPSDVGSHTSRPMWSLTDEGMRPHTGIQRGRFRSVDALIIATRPSTRPSSPGGYLP